MGPDKNLLILGAASDIGFATGLKFAAKGFNLVLAARNCQMLMEKAADVRTKYKVNVDLLEFDACKTNEHAQFAERLTCNADVVLIAFAINGDTDLEKAGGEETEKLFKTNFIGVVSIVHSLIVAGKLQRGSTIMVISSVSGDRAKRHNYAYSASKAALNNYLEGLRADLYPLGIDVINIKPGYIQTKMLPPGTAPNWLIGDCQTVAKDIFKAYQYKHHLIYTPWYWRYIMFAFRLIPSSVLKRLDI